jgi:hypothetical protein
MQRLHPSIEVENIRSGETLRRRCIGRRRDAFPYGGEQFIPANAGKGMLLGVEEDVDEHAVLRRHLVGGGP